MKIWNKIKTWLYNTDGYNPPPPGPTPKPPPAPPPPMYRVKYGG